MGKTVYYVAVDYEFSNPTIVEKFDNHNDAGIYAALMSRTKQNRYIILEQIGVRDGTSQEK